MPKFKKRPIPIEAEQWHPGKQVRGVCEELDFNGAILELNLSGKAFPHVHTLEGYHEVSPGDWIAKGIKGEYYPIKDEIFKLTYDEVGEALRIYVGGPLSNSDPAQVELNIHRASYVGYMLMMMGHYPYVPHCNERMENHGKGILSYEDWMRLDFTFLDSCDAFFYIASSPGTDRELARAESRGMIIFKDYTEVPDLRGVTA